MLALLGYDLLMLGSAAASVSAFNVAEAAGVSESQILAAFMGVCAVCYMLLRREVDRVLRAIAQVEDHERRIVQLENGSGPQLAYPGTERRTRRA